MAAPHNRLTLLFALGAGFAACSTTGGSVTMEVEKVYVPSFKFEDTAPVNDDMHAMAKAVYKLDRLMRDGNNLDDTEGAQAVALLAELSSITDRLVPNPAMTNHPVLKDRIADFDADVKAALDTARGKPPSYYMAGAVAGSCILCHER
ncbi:MAG: hypothetical protein KC933_13815 [Myxococcales bacterium]|nr:hypothetical protein [Myxococcales bacterium]MCB9647477.1 hypothetical protein [Deltaproteobacteria bacterium]